MITIHKYKLPINGYGTPFILKLPAHSEFLKTNIQRGIPRLWCLVADKNGLQDYEFIIYGTGWEVDSVNYMYVDTFFTEDDFVWHLFTKKPEKYRD